MKKSGFTLIELMGILVLLGIIFLITVPIITDSLDKSKDVAYETQIKQIEKAARDWTLKHPSDLPTEENDSINITLGILKQEGYVDMDIQDPVTLEPFLNCMFINIKRQNNKYVYEVLDSNLPEGCTAENNPFGPKIILKGSSEFELDINEEFKDPGVKATNSAGSEITKDDIDIKITKNNVEVPNVDTSTVGTYKIKYTVNKEGTSAEVYRTVTVKDKTAPVITVTFNGNDYTTRFNIEITKGSSFSIPNATASDEIDGVLTSKITIIGTVNPNVVGIYELEYSVSDNSGNRRSLKVVVNVKG